MDIEDGMRLTAWITGLLTLALLVASIVLTIMNIWSPDPRLTQTAALFVFVAVLPAIVWLATVLTLAAP